MSQSFQFVSKKQNYDAKHIKVFVHGYLSATDKCNKIELFEYIPDLPCDEDVLFAFWDSGSMKDMWIEVLQTAAGTFSFSQVGIVRSMAAAFAGGVNHFNDKKDSTRELGKAFFAELKQFTCKYPALQSISLYGHSLGGRLLIEALLANKANTSLKICNLTFMGGARELKPEELADILPQVKNRIYNFYSTSDMVLVAMPSFEKCVGRHPIPEPLSPFEDKVFNANLGIGHTDYWDILLTVFNYVRNEGERSISSVNMQYPYALEDPLLFPLLYWVEPADLQLISRVLATKFSCSIPADCVVAEQVIHEIQLMGGNSIANKTRGNRGVNYAEIVEDVAEKLKIGTKIGQSTTVDKEVLIYEKIIRVLRMWLHLDAIETPQDDSELLHHCFSVEHCAKSVEAINEMLGDITFDPAGPAFSVTIPLVGLIHYLRTQTDAHVPAVVAV